MTGNPNIHEGGSMRKVASALLACVGISLVALAMLSMERPADAQPRRPFDNRNLRGNYAFAGVQCCVLGQFNADGVGNITGSHTLAGGNDVHHESLSCTYEVFPNGTGTMTCTTVKLDGPDVGSSATGTNDFVLADGGGELFSIDTNQGGEVEGLVSVAKRQ
jgi:hypothetical protein